MLALTEVRAGYGRTPVLGGVDLDVADGHAVALLGRNGVGKTTLVRVVAGLLSATGGKVVFRGDDVTHVAAHRRARLGIGYVPQGRDVFGGLTVFDNLVAAAPVRRRSEALPLAEAMLEQFPALRPKGRDRAASLSGGQQQLLALARALIHKPRLLLLDEPSEGIQPSLVGELIAILRDINASQGVTILLVEQNLAFAAGVASRAYIMVKGRVVREVLPAEIAGDPAMQREYLGV